MGVSVGRLWNELLATGFRRSRPLMFTNVFVPPADYDYFLEHGTWPEKTMFVLEEYGSQSKGSINLHGHIRAN